MLDLLLGGVVICSAGLIAAGYYTPPSWTVALLCLSIGVRLFARGLADREDRRFGRTIDQYRAYKKDLRDRNG